MLSAPSFLSKSFTLANTTSSRLYSEGDHHDGDSDDSSASTQTESKYVFSGKENCKTATNTDILTGSVHSTVPFSKDQARRLRLVGSQAVLFVVSFLICNIWAGTTGLMENQGDTVQSNLAMLVRNYPIFVIQAIFSPLQGFFNMMVFIRPKYLKFRHLHKEESRLWVVRRAVFGEEVRPTIRPQRNIVESPNHLVAAGDNAAPEKNKPRGAQANEASPTATRLPRGMVSDLTASQGDFDHVMQEADDERWEDKATIENSRNAPLVSHRKRSSLVLWVSSALDIISENEPGLPENEDLVGDVFSPRTLHRRWSSDSLQQIVSGKKSKQEVALSMPERSVDSSSEDPVTDVFSPRTVHRRWSSDSLQQIVAGKKPKQEVALSIPERSVDSSSEDLVVDVFSPRTVHRRWSSDSLQQMASGSKPKQELSLAIPARLDSSFDSSIEETMVSSVHSPPPSPGMENTHAHKSRKSSSSMDSSTHRRWSSDLTPMVASGDKPRQELGLCIPARLESSFDSSIDETSVSSSPHPPSPGMENILTAKSRESSSSMDRPMVAPKRRMSPPSI
ncbi:MAG: hypothetical protein SGBAC_012442 [Bacillariaceae sp.]